MTGIVVGVDGSESGTRALRWAVREASLHQEPLTVVLAWGWAGHQTILGDQMTGAYADIDARAALDLYVKGALGTTEAALLETSAVCDLAARALLDTSQDASLLVLGGRGIGGFSGLVLGSVSQQCLHHATCPVAVVRQGSAIPAEAHKERIVVGIDGSPTARRALAWAVNEAGVRGAALEVVHAWTAPYVGGYPYTAPSFDPGVFESEAHRTMAAALDGVDTTGLADPVERAVANGDPTSVLLTAAKGADLVVLGSHGRGALGGLLLGSVSQHVAHGATCPLVILPADGIG